jgi:hypothetical protein
LCVVHGPSSYGKRNHWNFELVNMGGYNIQLTIFFSRR